MSMTKGQEQTLEELQEAVDETNGRLEEVREMFVGIADRTTPLIRMKERQGMVTMVSETPNNNEMTFVTLALGENSMVRIQDQDEVQAGLIEVLEDNVLSVDDLRTKLGVFCDAWDTRRQQLGF